MSTPPAQSWPQLRRQAAIRLRLRLLLQEIERNEHLPGADAGELERRHLDAALQELGSAHLQLAWLGAALHDLARAPRADADPGGAADDAPPASDALMADYRRRSAAARTAITQFLSTWD